VTWDHHDGLTRLVEYCGPQSFQNEPHRSAFEACREILVRDTFVPHYSHETHASQLSRSLQDRKRSFLEKEEWKYGPWATDRNSKNAAAHLVDQLASIPGLLEDEANLKTEDENARHCLRWRVLQHLEKLYEWRWAWMYANPEAVVETKSQVLSKENTPGESPLQLWTRLEYVSYTQVNDVGLYNAIQLWLLRLLWDLGGAESVEAKALFERMEKAGVAFHDAGHRSPLLLPGQGRSLEEVAIEICRSFEYQFIGFNGSRDSVLAWLLPIGLAYQLLVNDETEAELGEWVTKLLNRAPGSYRNACLYIAHSIRLGKDGSPDSNNA
jgi:hypothetical protein